MSAPKSIDQIRLVGFIPDGRGGFCKAKPQSQATASSGVDLEGPLHVDILKECRDNGWIAFHGSMACPTARTLGEPDFTILMPSRVLFIECKKRTGKLSPEQQALHAWMRKLGHTPYVVRSIEEFREIVNPKKEAL